jgi:hypothetical protein
MPRRYRRFPRDGRPPEIVHTFALPLFRRRRFIRSRGDRAAQSSHTRLFGNIDLDCPHTRHFLRRLVCCLNCSTIIAAAVGHNDLPERLLHGKSRPLTEVFSDPEPYRQQARAYLDGVATHYRIAAFCERSDSGLLWSHYANSYQGACLHFLAKGFRWRQYYSIGYVSYSKYRPTYP